MNFKGQRKSIAMNKLQGPSEPNLYNENCISHPFDTLKLLYEGLLLGQLFQFA